MVHNYIQPASEEEIDVVLREYVSNVPSEEQIRKLPSITPLIEAPLKLAWLTSVRDIGRADQNGRMVDYKGRPHYMMGLIEAINTIINKQRMGLEHIMQIVGIITDDTLRDKTYPYPTKPTPGQPWIHPLSAKNNQEELLTANTVNIPSNFRFELNKKRQKDQHREFEERIYEESQQMEADILVSDHFMVKIIHLIKAHRYGIGKVLNIHPGISDPLDLQRLPGSTPTQDALDSVRYGAIFKKSKGIYVPTIPRYRTGASLHIMNRGLDEGPVIADSRDTVVLANDTHQELRARNYPVKIAVFIAGMMHYITSILENIKNLDFNEEAQENRTTTRVRINRRSLL
jgi:folate-dependent phosphoribosylglycinamide formyltransferase PurN